MNKQAGRQTNRRICNGGEAAFQNEERAGSCQGVQGWSEDVVGRQAKGKLQGYQETQENTTRHDVTSQTGLSGDDCRDNWGS